MATVTRKAYGQDYTQRRTAYRIRVEREEPFRDFHLLLRKDRDTTAIFGNEGDEVAVLKPSPEDPGATDLEYGDMKSKRPKGPRVWDGVLDGWDVPKQNDLPDQEHVYVTFHRYECAEAEPTTRLTFDLVIDDLARVEKWVVTDDCNPQFTGGEGIVEEGTEIPEQ